MLPVIGPLPDLVAPGSDTARCGRERTETASESASRPRFVRGSFHRLATRFMGAFPTRYPGPNVVQGPGCRAPTPTGLSTIANAEEPGCRRQSFAGPAFAAES